MKRISDNGNRIFGGGAKNFKNGKVKEWTSSG